MQLPIVTPAPIVTAHAEAVGGSGGGDAALSRWIRRRGPWSHIISRCTGKIAGN